MDAMCAVQLTWVDLTVEQTLLMVPDISLTEESVQFPSSEVNACWAYLIQVLKSNHRAKKDHPFKNNWACLSKQPPKLKDLPSCKTLSSEVVCLRRPELTLPKYFDCGGLGEGKDMIITSLLFISPENPFRARKE